MTDKSVADPIRHTGRHSYPETFWAQVQPPPPKVGGDQSDVKSRHISFAISDHFGLTQAYGVSHSRLYGESVGANTHQDHSRGERPLSWDYRPSEFTLHNVQHNGTKKPQSPFPKRPSIARKQWNHVSVPKGGSAAPNTVQAKPYTLGSPPGAHVYPNKGSGIRF